MQSRLFTYCLRLLSCYKETELSVCNRGVTIKSVISAFFTQQCCRLCSREGETLRKGLWNLLPFTSPYRFRCLRARDVPPLWISSALFSAQRSFSEPTPRAQSKGHSRVIPQSHLNPLPVTVAGGNHFCKLPSIQGWEDDDMVWPGLSIPKLRGSTLFRKDTIGSLLHMPSFLLSVTAECDFIQSITVSSSKITFFSLIYSSGQGDINGSVPHFENSYY